MALRLARAGYGGGDPDRIMMMPTETVFDISQYEDFCGSYERTWMKLNEPKKGDA